MAKYFTNRWRALNFAVIRSAKVEIRRSVLGTADRTMHGDVLGLMGAEQPRLLDHAHAGPRSGRREP